MIKDFNKVAIITKEREISYTSLIQYVNYYSKQNDSKPEEKVLLFSENREGWLFAFFSIWANKSIAVPVDASSTVHDVAYIINDCRPASAWVSKNCEETIRKAIAETGIDVKINLIDDSENADVSSMPTAIDTVPEESSTALIIYTSGTTGSPKGVMLSYANLYANLRGVCDEVPIINEHRRIIILLPLHHVLPLMGTVIAPILRGGGVAICPSMTGPDIMDTLCRGQIGIMIGVPRLWQTLYTGIKKKIDASPVTRTLFNICKKANSRTLSRFVFQSIRKKMGGHLDYCVSGGAALDKEIGEGLRTLGLDVLEGYGMTETAPIIAFTRPGDIIPGCVGLPLPSVECKIVNGELCAKGPNVMQGYYNRPEETAAVIDKDGFIHTGDLARFDEKGRVIITGRSKEIIVLSNGKNVQPSEIEYKLEKHDDKVKEAAIVQDGDMLRAIIVPQDAWSSGMNDAEIQEALKREVLEPYNLTVTNYKKVMSLMVYHGDLPRTKLDKLQRFKLKDILANAGKQEKADAPEIEEPKDEAYQILKKYIEEEKKIKVRPTDHLETDLAFDSLDRVSLQGFIEQTFGIEINADTMSTYANVQAISEHINEKKTRTEVADTDWHKLLTEEHTELDLPSSSFIHKLGAKLFKGFLKCHNGLKIYGKENIPAEGPFIIAPNHQSFLDGPIVMTGMSWNEVSGYYFYATEEHVQHPVLKYLARRNNIILMERRNLKNSILKLAEVIRKGKNVVIFPEGSRTHDGDMIPFKKMFAILSTELQVPVVPVCIKGAFEANPRSKKFISTARISVKYLPAVAPQAGDDYNSFAKKIHNIIESELKK